MKLELLDYVALTFGIGVAILGHYAGISQVVFVGGAWVGAFIFKLGYICEERWGGRP